MKRFTEYLLEGKFLYGINHTDKGAGDEIKKLANVLGYEIKEGGSHIRIIDKKTGEGVTSISRGREIHPGRFRTALTQISRHQRSINGNDGTKQDMKELKRNKLREEKEKVWKATLKVTKGEETIEVPVESSDNIRKAVHAKMAELGKEGYKLKDVDYEH